MADLEVMCHAANEDNRHWAVDTKGLKVRFLNLKFIRLGYERRIYLGSRRVRLSTIRSRDAIFLDGWDSLIALQVLILAKVCRRPVVLSYWSTTLTHRYNRGPVAIYRQIFMRQCTAILTPGKFATDAARRALEGSKVKIKRGNASVDLDHWESARNFRQKNSDATRHTFLYVGQLIERKNVGLLLEAFDELNATGDRLLIVGTGPEKENLSSKANGSESVKFLGDLQEDELLEAYASADTLILPSAEEVWGLVSLEALAAGLHVVVSDVSGAAGDLAKFQSVFTFSSGSLTSLVEAMTASRLKWNGPNCEKLRPDFEPAHMAETIRDLALELQVKN